MGFKAINERFQSGSTPAGESYEAKEGRVVQDYEAALRMLATGAKHQAMAAFESLLQCELLVAAKDPRTKPTETIQQVRFLVLKNQAEMLASADATARDALHLYLAALDQTRDDPVLWHHAGSLAAELAEWGVARYALEQSLKRSSGNVLVAEKLLEVLLQIGDFQAAEGISRHLLQIHPAHHRAGQLSTCLNGGAEEARDLEAEAVVLQPKFPLRLRAAQPPPAAVTAAVLDIPKLSWQAVLDALISHIEHGSLSQSVGIPCQITIDGQSLEVAKRGLEAFEDASASPRPMEMDGTSEQVALAAATETANGAVLPDEDAAAAPSGNGVEAAEEGAREPEQAGTAPPADGRAATVEEATDNAAQEQLKPQRASKRLVARKARGEEGDGGGSGAGVGGENQRNVIAMLSPFLGSRPTAAAQPPVGQGEPPPGAVLPAPSEARQALAVVRLLERHCGSASVPQLAAAVVTQLSDAPPERQLPEGVLELLLKLDLLVGGWERPPDSALLLAELHLEKAVGVASKARPRGGAAVKSSSEDAATVRRHMQATRSNLGQYALGTSRTLVAVPAKELRRQQLRRLWVQARCWEQTGRDSDAAAAFDACLVLCRRGASIRSPEQQVPVDGSEDGLAGNDDDCTIVLANCTRDNVISADAIEPRIANTQLLALVAAATVALREGRHAEAVTSLAPKCLGAAAGVDRACHVRALGILKDALAGVEGEEFLGVEIVARLMHVARKLRRVPDDIDDSSLHTAPCGGRQPPRGVDVARALRPTGNPGGKPQNLLDLAAAADRIAKLRADGWHWKPDAVAGLDLEPLDSPRLQELVREAQWKLLASAERAYWAIPTGRKSSHPDLDSMNREVLVASLAAIALLQQLEESAPLDAGSLLDLLGGCLQLAEERRAVGALDHALPHSCLTSLSQALDRVKAGGMETDTEEVERLRAAKAQCLYLIYGVDFDERDPEWGSSKEQQEQQQELALKSRADCLALWPHLCDVAEAAESSAQLASLKGVLKRVAEFFQPPLEAELSQQPMLRLLDGPDPDLRRLLTASDAADIFPAPAPSSQASPQLEVQARLYGLQLQIEAAEVQSSGGEDSEGLEAVLAFARADLHFNPRSFSTWSALAGCHRRAYQAVLEESQPQEEETQLREQMLRRRALRATALVRLVLPEGDGRAAGSCEQELGLLLLTEARIFKQQGDAESHRWHCEQAAAAFQRAAAALPEEWQSEYQLGKSLAKLGAPAGTVLHHYARACWLATTLVGGRVEPLYRLHAARLKLLLQDDAGEVDAVRKFCFLESTVDSLREMQAPTPPGEAGEEPAAKRPRLATGGYSAHQVLVEDCLAALRFCLDWSKGFHKARFALARAADRAGEGPAAAAEELRPLFSRSGGAGKKTFSIAVDPIQDPDAREYGAGRHGERLEAASGREAGQEAAWGRQPPGRIAGVGLQESSRKHAAALHKYLSYYLRLLAATRDVPRLQAAVHCLKLPTTSSQHPGLASLLDVATGMLLTVLAAQASVLLAEAFKPQPAAQEATQGWELQRELSEAEAATLEAAFQVYSEHSAVLDGGKAGKWGECYDAPLAACEGVRDCLPTVDAGSLGEAAFGRYARGYITHLGRRQDAERLWAIASKSLRRLKHIPAAERATGVLPDHQTAVVLGAACSSCMASCLARLEQACANRSRAAAEKASREAEPAEDAPDAPARQPDNAVEASGAEQAEAAPPPESAATTQGGSPVKRKAEALEAAKRVARSPAATQNPRRAEPSTPESPLKSLAVEGYRALRLLYGLHRACRQLVPATDSQEQQADRDAMLVRAVVAYTHMMHGDDVWVAPLGIRDAEAMAAELGRQAGKAGGAPLPNLANRTVTAAGSQLRESPIAPAAPAAQATPSRAVPQGAAEPRVPASPLQALLSGIRAEPAVSPTQPHQPAAQVLPQQSGGAAAARCEPAAGPARGNGLFTAAPHTANDTQPNRPGVVRQQTDWLLSQLSSVRRDSLSPQVLASTVPQPFPPPGGESQGS